MCYIYDCCIYIIKEVLKMRRKENFGITYLDDSPEEESGEKETVKIIFSIDKRVRDRFKKQSEEKFGLSMSARLRQFIYQSINKE